MCTKELEPSFSVARRLIFFWNCQFSYEISQSVKKGFEVGLIRLHSNLLVKLCDTFNYNKNCHCCFRREYSSQTICGQSKFEDV
uniref:Uncharacterized protein n=1 Tax=Pararge aegeria TaxID=116150 RepID=S4NS70_9NEOP